MIKSVQTGSGPAEPAGAPGHDEELRAVLRARGWVSDRYSTPEHSDEFEWPDSTPAPQAGPTASTGTVIYLEPGVCWVFAPQRDEHWRPPRSTYRTHQDLLADLDSIERWRCSSDGQAEAG